MELLGLEKKEGQKVTLSFYADAADYSMTGMINMDVNFSNSFSIEEKMNHVDLESGYSLNKNDKNYHFYIYKRGTLCYNTIIRYREAPK